MKKLLYILLLIALLTPVTGCYGDAVDPNNVVNAPDTALAVQGDKGATVTQDASTNALTIITYSHHEIHGGSFYTCTYNDIDFDIADKAEILITTPDSEKLTHLFFEVVAALDTTVILNEDSTHTQDVMQPCYNNRRDSTNVAGTTFYTHNDDGINGVPVFTTTFGIDTGVGANRIAGGGTSRNDSEWILRPNTKYLFLVSTATDDSTLAIIFKFYEHTDKN